MSVDNIDTSSLLARAAAYDNSNQLQVTPEESIKDAGRFQDIVNLNFNKFAGMSPEQILSHIKNIKEMGSSGLSQNGAMSSFLREIGDKVRHKDRVIRKAIVDQASLLDVVEATTEARVTVQTMVAVRDKFFDAFEKVMNMQI